MLSFEKLHSKMKYNNLFFQLKNIIKFCVVGLTSTAIDLYIYIFLSGYLHVIVAKILSMTVASVLSYYINKCWTFKNKSKTSLVSLIKYYLTFLINLSTNTTINFLLYRSTGNKLLSFFIATGCAMTINYILQRFFVFKTEIKGGKK